MLKEIEVPSKGVNAYEFIKDRLCQTEPVSFFPDFSWPSDLAGLQ